MNKKALIIVLSLILSACVTSPDPRPEPFLKSEALLREGLNAYQNDNFSEAQQKFSRALELYQSFDNQQGITLSRLNLLETALAVSDFKNAELYLKQLKQQAASKEAEENLNRKIILLESKLQFEQQRYPAALTTLQPLLTELNRQKKTDEMLLNLLAMQARLEILISPLIQSKGLSQFEAALAQNEPQPQYQVMLKRISAMIAAKRGEYQKAATLLKEALAYYKEQASRRSIAACLEELAELEMAQQHQKEAREYLNKALVIRQWLKNDYKVNKIKQRLATIK